MKLSAESFISEEPTDGGQWLSAVLVPLVDNLKDQSSPALKQPFVELNRRAGTGLYKTLERAGQEAGVYRQTYASV